MSSTNKTTNYDLSQFLGSDKPAWLVDYNGDMTKIDAQMKANADAAAAAGTNAASANTKADANTAAIQNLDTEINGQSGITTDLASLQGAVNTITSLIGNGEPTTTDKTLIGAINEINSDKEDIVDKVNNMFLPYSPRTTHVYTPTSAGTFGDILIAAVADFLSYVQSLQDNQRVHLNYVQIGDLIYTVTGDLFLSNAVNAITIELTRVAVDANGLNIRNVRVSNTALARFFTEAIDATGNITLTDFSNNTFSQSVTFEYSIYNRVELS